MRLALKVVFATVLGVLIVIAVFGSIHVHREVSLFDSDMRSDHRIIGTTLSACVASIWWTEGSERALELIAHADEDRADLGIDWVQPDGRRAERAHGISEPRDQPLDRVVQTVRNDPGNRQGAYLVTRIPVRSRGELLGAIEIDESLAPRDDFIRESVWNTAIAIVAMIGVSTGVVLVLGVWLVGRPLDKLAEKARRVAQGDLSNPLRLNQRDEIGQLAAEMNAMCDRLGEANARTQSESAARITALEQLRHADRLATVGKLAAGIAHELGTPLNVVAGRAKMLRKNPTDTGNVAEYAAIIAEQAERMTVIIRQLLDFARRREPKNSAADLGTIARAIARLLEPLARKHGVEVRVVADERVLALGDPMSLEQVASNLVANAIHACAEGGHVQISVGTDVVTPPAGHSDTRGLRAYLRVKDDGSGIDSETRRRIFEPFFTTKGVGQGTGLGLSVAHGIVQEHGGFIDVDSAPGRGSVFSVYLPMTSTSTNQPLLPQANA